MLIIIYYFLNLTVYPFICSERFRTINNVLGDCYCAAVVAQLSKKELMAMDEEEEAETDRNGKTR